MKDFIFVILKSSNNTTYLNRFDENVWDKVKPHLIPESIIYVTKDIHDEELSEFDNINYNSIFHPLEKRFHYINVPFTPDNIETMEEESNKKYNELKEKYNQQVLEKENRRNERIQKKHDQNVENGNYERLIQRQKEADELIPMDTNEMDAILKWKDSGFSMPAARRISQIKESYNMTWSEFKFYVKDNF